MRRIIAAFLILLPLIGCSQNVKHQEAWHRADSIADNITVPVFPDRSFNIIDFGAVPDGKTLSTEAIQKAIDICNHNYGGTVIIPGGKFLTGAIHLKSNVNLHISEGATLLFSVNPEHYLPLVLTRWEGVDCYNYSPLIYAYEEENIAITGKGKLDGQANNTNWWPWKGKKEYGWKENMPSQLLPEGRPRLLNFEQTKTPLSGRKMGEGHYLRPQFINLYRCSNILLEDFTIINSPFWIIHPLMSDNITMRGLNINSHGPNNDGCDPESVNMMLIEDCYFNTGDDCIAIKSGRNYDGRKWDMPSKNIVVRNCSMEEGHGGVVFGSEISGGAQYIFAENCTMNSPHLERAIRIKTNALRGGVITDLFFRNIKIGEVDEAVVKINCLYEMDEDETGNYPPLIKDIYISDIESQASDYALFMEGIEGEDCIKRIHISDSRFEGVKKGNYIKNTRDINLENIYINGEQKTTID